MQEKQIKRSDKQQLHKGFIFVHKNYAKVQSHGEKNSYGKMLNLLKRSKSNTKTGRQKQSGRNLHGNLATEGREKAREEDRERERWRRAVNSKNKTSLWRHVSDRAGGRARER